MRRYLIVANQTLGGERLLDLVSERRSQGPSSFHVVVPATPTIDDMVGASAMYGGVLGAEGLALPIDPEEQYAAYERAAERLADARARLTRLGIETTGEVSDPDPLVAIEAAMQEHPADEILLSTLPPGLSRWLKMDLVNRAARRFDVAITHVYAVDEPAPT